MLCLYPEPLTSVSFGLPASHSHSFSIPRRKTRLRLGYEVSALSDYQPLYLPDSLRRFGRAGHSLQTGATELFAEYVMPACKQMNAGRDSSIDWIGDNSARFFGAMQQATREAIAKYKTRA